MSLDSAVTYYKHLVEQDLHPEAALDHAAQRFGIGRDTIASQVLRERKLRDARVLLARSRDLAKPGSEGEVMYLRMAVIRLLEWAEGAP